MSSHSPFAVDERNASGALTVTWGTAYEIRFRDGTWYAERRAGPAAELSAATPDELVREMAADWGTWPEGWHPPSGAM